ncbi:hypothetical protein HYG87_01330 [Methanobacterium alkalithermotolerans]|uniref:Uncharacterized protein n=1 Tax=Methanobacterium alkalithermotolerans TaxID=2731220 RepID=A0A8T8K5X9_9EURY|nr:hypothetical protein [Methanobacterium alkalithermotolerans]QUH22500.1 hypothetical protein HYG87_01330 [Methanobacterium alkalithermotolerans]
MISYSESGSLENLNECCNDSLSINTSNECCIVPENQSVKKDELLDHNNTSDDCCK